MIVKLKIKISFDFGVRVEIFRVRIGLPIDENVFVGLAGVDFKLNFRLPAQESIFGN